MLHVLEQGVAGHLPSGWPLEPGGGWIDEGLAMLRVGNWRIRLRMSGGVVEYVDGAASPEGREVGYAVLGGILHGMPRERRARFEEWVSGLGPWA